MHDLRYGSLPHLVRQSNPYSIQNIKLWLKLNYKPFELISEEYIDANKLLEWKCLKEECNEIFEMTWDRIQLGVGCACCRGMQVGLSNCLATKNPSLASQWHPTKNGNLTPYDVTCGSRTNAWWQCENGHEWQAIVNYRNNRPECPYCSHATPSKEYNLLIINPKICEEWDYIKNDKNPEEYLPYSSQNIWWQCNECGYEFQMVIASRNRGGGCPECSEPQGEKRIRHWLEKNDIDYITQKEFDGLLGIKNGNLSYDFYLPNIQYNLLIEYQGEQHEHPVDFYGKGIEYTQQQFIKQQEHDRRKRKYANNNNINLLEIWYYDFDNIEKILNNKICAGK